MCGRYYLHFSKLVFISGWIKANLTSVLQVCPIVGCGVILVHLKIPIEELLAITLGVPCFKLPPVPLCPHLKKKKRNPAW
jgi:hypothetical protein